MEDLKKNSAAETREQPLEAEKEQGKKELSPTWAQDCIEDIDDWIESQGIYIRQ